MTTSLPIRTVPDVGDIVHLRPDHKDIRYYSDFKGEPTTYRVTSWMKAWVRPERPAPDPDSVEAVVAAMLQDILDDGNREFDCGKGPTRLQWCTQEEAEYVSVTGVCGHIWPVEDVVVVGKVAWSDKMIGEAREQAQRRVGEVLF